MIAEENSLVLMRRESAKNPNLSMVCTMSVY